MLSYTGEIYWRDYFTSALSSVAFTDTCRTNVVKVLDSFQYDDVNDIFQRPPFSVYVQAINQQSRGTSLQS